MNCFIEIEISSPLKQKLLEPAQFTSLCTVSPDIYPIIFKVASLHRLS